MVTNGLTDSDPSRIDQNIDRPERRLYGVDEMANAVYLAYVQVVAEHWGIPGSKRIRSIISHRAAPQRHGRAPNGQRVTNRPPDT